MCCALFPRRLLPQLFTSLCGVILLTQREQSDKTIDTKLIELQSRKGLKLVLGTFSNFTADLVLRSKLLYSINLQL